MCTMYHNTDIWQNLGEVIWNQGVSEIRHLWFHMSGVGGGGIKGGFLPGGSFGGGGGGGTELAPV